MAPTIILLVFVIVLSFLSFALLSDEQQQRILVPIRSSLLFIKECLLRCTLRKSIGSLSICIVLLLITRTISSKPESSAVVDTSLELSATTHSKFEFPDDDIDASSRIGTQTRGSSGDKDKIIRKHYPTPVCKGRRTLKDGRTIKPGEVLYDDRGMIIHAHGGGILVPKQAGAPHSRYFWYGESAKNETNPAVQCYSSDDLYRWRFEGRMIDAAAVSRSLWMNRDVIGGEGLAQDTVNDTLSPKGPRIVVERPKVVFCPTTRLYVMYFHLDHYQMSTPHYHWRVVGVATSRYAVGPFILKKVLRPDNLPSLDLTLHQVREGDEPHTYAGDVFLIRSVDNRQVAVSRLSNDFMDTEGDAPISMTEDPLEGYGIVESLEDRKYYLLASLLRGWMPSPLQLFELSISNDEVEKSEHESQLEQNIKHHRKKDSGLSREVENKKKEQQQHSIASLGKKNTWWKGPLPSPSTSVTTHFSQCSFVIPMCDAKGNPYFVYLGDRWNMHPRSPVSYGKGLAGANYIFLPLFFNSSNHLLLPWRDNWDLDDPFPSGVDSYPASNEQYLAPKRGKYSKLGKLNNANSELDLTTSHTQERAIIDQFEQKDTYSRTIDKGSTGLEASLNGLSEMQTQKERGIQLEGENDGWGSKELDRIRGVLDDDWIGSPSQTTPQLDRSKDDEEKKAEPNHMSISGEEDGEDVHVFVVAANYVDQSDAQK